MLKFNTKTNIGISLNASRTVRRNARKYEHLAFVGKLYQNCSQEQNLKRGGHFV